jgi:hypothetical protein
VLAEGLPKRAAIEAVFEGRMVCCVDEETCREGEGGTSAAAAVPRVFSHGGGFCEASLVVACRRGVCDGVEGVGFNGELVGVDGRCDDDVGRRKGDVRGLLKDSGEGL